MPTNEKPSSCPFCASANTENDYGHTVECRACHATAKPELWRALCIKINRLSNQAHCGHSRGAKPEVAGCAECGYGCDCPDHS